MIVQLSIRRRWWVTPYCWLVFGFISTIAWALDDDDDRVEAFAARQGEFVGKYGFKCVTTAVADSD